MPAGPGRRRFDEFILPDWNLGPDKSQRADNLARIKAEVLDQLTG